MTVVNCLSSTDMNQLMKWRNPNGAEENWAMSGFDISSIHRNPLKIITAEAGLLVISITSTIETVALSLLSLVSLVFSPIEPRPFNYFVKLLESSSFTILWSVAGFFFINLIYPNVFTNESFARKFADRYNPFPFNFFRVEDRLYISDWIYQHNPNPSQTQVPMVNGLIQTGNVTEKIIANGAGFISNYLLQGVNVDLKEKFNEVDPSIIMLFLTKAIFIYTFGQKKGEVAPLFFKSKTRIEINRLRQEKVNIDEIEHCFESIDGFEKGSAKQQAIFNRLKNIASCELQDGLFITRCWQKATR